MNKDTIGIPQGHKQGRKCKIKGSKDQNWHTCLGFQFITDTYRVRHDDGSIGWYPPNQLVWK